MQLPRERVIAVPSAITGHGGGPAGTRGTPVVPVRPKLDNHSLGSPAFQFETQPKQQTSNTPPAQQISKRRLTEAEYKVMMDLGKKYGYAVTEIPVEEIHQVAFQLNITTSRLVNFLYNT